MTEVNPVLVRYRRDRANAFEQPGAPGVLDHLSGAREMIGELLNLNPTPPKPALSEPVELIYDGGKTKQTLVYRADGNVCKVALTPDAEDRLRNEYALLGGPFKGYEMFPQVDGMAYVEDRRIGGKHLCLRERFVEGEDVLAHVERRASEGWPLSSRELFSLVLGMFDAMAVVCRAGYIHRDPHPGNWIVTPDGHVVLIDFGLCASVAECAGPLVGERVISRGYEAPELRSLGLASPASDVYSTAKVIAKFMFGTRDVRALPRTVPFADFLRRAMAQKPAARYADAYAARAALMASYRS